MNPQAGGRSVRSRHTSSAVAKSRLDHLNGQLVNLSIKIDRMLAEAPSKSSPSASAASKPAAVRKPASKTSRKK